MPPTTLEALEAALGRPRVDVPDGVVGVVGTRRAKLADFPAATHFAEGEEFACLLAPVSGGPGGVMVLAFHLEGALRFVAPARGPAAEERLRELGMPVLHELAARLGAGAPPPGSGTLHEGSLVSAVLRTHAPRDASLLSAELRVGGARQVPALCYVLLDGKGLDP